MLAKGIEVLLLFTIAVWGFSALSARLQVRAEGRRAVGRHLARLLDVRHRLLSFRMIIDELAKNSKVTPQDLSPLRATLRCVLPEFEELNKELESSTAFIAESSPFLAFRLRLKHFQFHVFNRFGSFAPLGDAEYPGWLQLQQESLAVVLEGLDEMILALARRHTWRSWLATRDYLRRPLELPSEMEQVLAGLGAEYPVEGQEPKAA